MEKLKPLLVHRFWIAFGLALLLPGIGWGLGSRALDLEIQTAWDQAENAFNTIPARNSANPKWLDSVDPQTGRRTGLRNRNSKLTSLYNDSKLYLGETQKRQMKWPVGNTEKSQEVGGLWHQVDGELQEIPSNGYEGHIPRQLCRDYRELYFRELERIHKTVDPYDTLFWTGKGKVIFNLISVMPLVRELDWARLPPTPREVWAAQEDLWLLESLLSAIVEVNLEAKSLTESPIRQISQIVLRGGDLAALKSMSQSASAVPAGARGGGYSSGGGEEGMGTGPTFGLGGATGGRGGVSINLDQLFGPVGGGFGGGGGEEGMGGGPGLTFGLGGANAPKRYVDDEAGAPFKTRGFLLQVVMDHRKLPELKIQLSNLEWPVEIVQVHQVEGVQTASLSSGGLSGGGEEGMGAGSTSAGMRNMNLGVGGFGLGQSQTPLSPNGLPPGFPNISFTEAQEIMQKAREMYFSALQGPFLVSVAIAGKMTLFQPADGQSTASVAAANGAASAAAGSDSQTAPGTVDRLQEPPGAEPSGDVVADDTLIPAATQIPSAQQAGSSETKSDSQPASQPQKPTGDGTPSQQPSPASSGPAAGKSPEDSSG